MWRSTIISCLLLSTLTLAPTRVSACSCAHMHPQVQFCESDFVAVVKVRKMIPVNEYEVAYKVKFNRLFKSDEKTDLALKYNLLWTASMDTMCGVTLDVGEIYVVSGRVISGKPRISICGLSKRWSSITSRQRKGFRLLYHHGCVCQIRYTPWWRKGEALESVGGKSCLWESTPGPQDCQEKFGVCMLGPSGCAWTASVPYKNCIKEHQRQREQQRLREP